jgi:AbrB family looped-hinge helix DNA binding protein
MGTTSVTSKGQVTIPLAMRKRLGIHQGSRLEFTVVEDRLEVRVANTPALVSTGGFGLVKTKRPAAPADLDPAGLLAGRKRP